MASVYVAKMNLSCDPQDSTVLPAFYARWTSTVQDAWSVLAIDGARSEAQLAKELNRIIETEFIGTIAADLGLGGKGDVKEVRAFEPTMWTPGGGGMHKAIATVVVELTKGGNTEWTFKAAGKQPMMRAEVLWRKVGVKP